MNKLKSSHLALFSIRRRTVLTGMVASSIQVIVGPALAQTLGLSRFLTLSLLLTGRSALDERQGALIHEALRADREGIDEQVDALLSLIESGGVDLGGMQEILEANEPELASLPRQIMKAWYTGVVGERPQERCVTFENSLMHQTVAGHLHPPSYCYGQYGSWTAAP